MLLFLFLLCRTCFRKYIRIYEIMHPTFPPLVVLHFVNGFESHFRPFNAKRIRRIFEIIDILIS